ncbi:hypothetical protein F4774DRAFT_390281 [Daldinia eschscholtzii]|nr:hypothetical protein F4774DRAFT_390281 [Daldinia eschscholtzii]
MPNLRKIDLHRTSSHHADQHFQLSFFTTPCTRPRPLYALLYLLFFVSFVSLRQTVQTVFDCRGRQAKCFRRAILIFLVIFVLLPFTLNIAYFRFGRTTGAVMRPLCDRVVTRVVTRVVVRNTAYLREFEVY